MRATDEEIAYARALPEGIYYGGARGIYRLDDKSAARLARRLVVRRGQAARRAGAHRLSLGRLRAGAVGDRRLRSQSPLVARRATPAPASATTSRSCTAIASSSRSTPRAGKLRWVYAHPRTDVVASEDAGTAIVFASADGDVGLIDPASGAVRVVQRTGLRVAGASFDADGVTAGAGAQPPTEEEVAHTLEQIVWDHDARFGAVKVFAVDALGGVPGLPVSRALLKIVRAAPAPGGPPPAAQQHAGEALVARKDRAAVPLHARGARRALRLPRGQGSRAASTCMARALAALDVKEAAPLLAAHLGGSRDAGARR